MRDTLKEGPDVCARNVAKEFAIEEVTIPRL